MNEGFYPVQGNRWKRGDEECICPLYEGKMVQAFDHRAASVVVNPRNLNRPGPAAPSHARRARRSKLAARSRSSGSVQDSVRVALAT